MSSKIEIYNCLSPSHQEVCHTLDRIHWTKCPDNWIPTIFLQFILNLSMHLSRNSATVAVYRSTNNFCDLVPLLKPLLNFRIASWAETLLQLKQICTYNSWTRSSSFSTSFDISATRATSFRDDNTKTFESSCHLGRLLTQRPVTLKVAWSWLHLIHVSQSPWVLRPSKSCPSFGIQPV